MKNDLFINDLKEISSDFSELDLVENKSLLSSRAERGDLLGSTKERHTI